MVDPTTIAAEARGRGRRRVGPLGVAVLALAATLVGPAQASAGDASTASGPAVIVFDAMGDPVATTHLAPWIDVTAMAVDARGAATVVGRSADGQDAARRLDADGRSAWTRHLDRGAVVDDAAAGALGSVALVGSMHAADHGVFDGTVWLLDADGRVRWSTRFGPVRGPYSTRVALDGQGNVVVAATVERRAPGPGSDSAVQADIDVITIDATGRIVHRRTLRTPGDHQLRALAVSRSGAVHVAGMTTVLDPDWATLDVDWASSTFVAGWWPFVARLDPGARDLQWVQQFGSAAGSSVHGMAVDARDHVWVVGAHLRPGAEATAGPATDTWVPFLREHAPDGRLRSRRAEAVGAHDAVFAGVSASPLGDGVVVAAGAARQEPSAVPREHLGPAGADAVVRTYAAGGDAAWTRWMRTGSGLRGVVDIAVDATGNVLVLVRARP